MRNWFVAGTSLNGLHIVEAPGETSARRFAVGGEQAARELAELLNGLERRADLAACETEGTLFGHDLVDAGETLDRARLAVDRARYLVGRRVSMEADRRPDNPPPVAAPVDTGRRHRPGSFDVYG